MDYDYDYRTRISDPAYYIAVGTDNDQMAKAQSMMDALSINGIAVVGNLYFYNMQDMRNFMFFWKAK